MRRGLAGVAAAAAVLAVAGCGGGGGGGKTDAPPPAPAARGGSTDAVRHPVLHLERSRVLPAPVQLPGLAAAGGAVLAAGGLDAADTSVADVLRVSPGRPRRVGSLGQALHDVGATTLGSRVYVFGGGSASG